MLKFCTDIKQSKKLKKLGIDRKTSDMYYWCSSDLRIGGYKAQDEELDIPAWSLSALLCLLKEPALEQYNDNKWCCVDYTNGQMNRITSQESPIDACVKLIICLCEKGLL